MPIQTSTTLAEDPCASQPCGGGGRCVAGAGWWACECGAGWAGPDCAAPLCEPPCPPPAACTAARRCECPPPP
ncbi:unnamed protein product [Leptidea sinapis]|uniref:EGF-like domain-containing protein n=1 Tax=Leptidea sinapis TaxID=189913 RepID=A0A5E4Q3M3_9NEOP|nr:unnamed protein product [Leptidea sinapis]